MTIWEPTGLAGSGPRYLALADAIGADIAAGRLSPGDRLPPQRELARRLGVTIATVGRAYHVAARRGLLSGEVGRGTFVAPARTPPAAADTPALDVATVHPPGHGPVHRAVAPILHRIAADPLAVGAEDADAVRHRIAGARWMAHAGWRPEPDTVEVTAGGQHGLAAALAAVAQPRQVVVTTELTNPGLLAAARLLHIELATVPSDAAGPRPDAIDRLCARRRVAALHLHPTLHNPTGLTMPADRRREIAAVAAAHDLTVIEEDPFGALRPDRPPPVAAWHPRTVHLTGITKTLAPGLRIGYRYAPAALAEPLRAAARALAWAPAPLVAEVATQLVLSGSAHRLAAARAAELAGRAALARDLLGDRVTLDGPAPFAWVRLDHDAEPVTALARRRGIAVAGVDEFAARRGVPPGLRVSLSADEDAVRTALRALARLLPG
ncbi:MULTISPECIES: PLP-dependent aminotransferase family protein [Micromonospora]|uniref:PLP-dependent aminotransferase family protein n=1 Tax=Micromonospora solifontis TaxID=2487138 RepID=A0ABX9WJN3_9ACTN|nr:MULTISPECIES: PLP-dependent aminotransferase family protein [Micromonospora]NES15985.1 PLP-dependent aminotransferase family protein [Micromonospora sp. PPF5-17B]NES36594.1 PLP-dependent aminotransferase family protein [Micromonospora solifontis]NES57344.1 PLP-dependent aminotransferase family protein [Micromonospora sp. PPF5-6]RNL99332.1 PLP-dependent aminotransferase family protein [Micromonospora solifontis]